ncbi:hypothetical protein PM082_012382 [Marasmius tenuissimus]|nr:hypothetical protein PM082_012382 [Marasmius tenuissimus]
MILGCRRIRGGQRADLATPSSSAHCLRFSENHLVHVVFWSGGNDILSYPFTRTSHSLSIPSQTRRSFLSTTVQAQNITLGILRWSYHANKAPLSDLQIVYSRGLPTLRLSGWKW